MTSSDKDQHRDETETLIDAQSVVADRTADVQTEKAPAPNFNHPEGEAIVKQESLSSLDDQGLRALLERDTQNSKYGNAIEMQKSRASDPDAGTNAGVQYRRSPAAAIPTEYEYHTDRILFVVVIGLLFLSLIGWGAYLLFNRPATVSPVSEYEVLTDNATVGGVSTSTTVTDRIQDSLDALEAVTASSNPKPDTDVATAPAAREPAVSKPTESSQPRTPPVFTKSSTVEPARSAPVAEVQAPRTVARTAQPPATTAAPEKPEFQLGAGSPATEAIQPTGNLLIQDPSSIARASLARGISSLEPVDAYDDGIVSLEGRDSFRLFWFTQITGQSEQKVSHVWFYNGEQVARIEMNIGSNSWRASTNKGITQQTIGQWRVEAVASNGDVLASQRFTVVE